MNGLLSAMFSIAGIFIVIAIVLIINRSGRKKREASNAYLLFNRFVFSAFFLIVAISLLYGATNLQLMIEKFETLTNVVSEETFLEVYDSQDDFLYHLGYPVVSYMMAYVVLFGLVVGLLYVNLNNLYFNIVELVKRSTDKPYRRLQVALERDRTFDYKITKDNLVHAFYDFQSSNSTKEIYYDDLKYIALAILEFDEVKAKEILNNATKQKESKMNKGEKLSVFDLKNRVLFYIEKRKGIKLKVN